MKLSELNKGDVFSKNGIEFVVINHNGAQTTVVTKDISVMKVFDKESASWATASIRNFLNTEMLREMESAFGSENILYSETDMTSLDGRINYGKCMDKVRLMTAEEIKQNLDLINTTGEWELSVTPWTVADVGGEYTLCLVAYRGYLRNYDCRSIGAVRPLMVVNADMEI